MKELTNTEWLRQRLTERVTIAPIGDKTESLAELRESEWFPEFIEWMRNRLLVGRFRYGRMDDPNKGNYDHIGSIRQRLTLYEQDGNIEHLVDCSNLCLVEARHSKHPNAHFAGTDDIIHCEKIGG